MFDVKNSKFYSELMNGFAKFFGLDAEKTTEAELDAELQKAGTLADIQANAKNEALLTVQSTMDDFSARLEGLEAKVTERDATIASMTATIQEKETELETLRADVAAKLTIVDAKEAKIKQLAGEVSALKTGKETQHDTNGGAADHYGSAANKVEAVEATELNKRFGFAAN